MKLKPINIKNKFENFKQQWQPHIITGTIESERTVKEEHYI